MSGGRDCFVTALAGRPLRHARRQQAIVALGFLADAESGTKAEYDEFQKYMLDLLLENNGRHDVALRAAGLVTHDTTRTERLAMIQAIYGNLRARKMLDEKRADLTEQKDAVLARLINVAVYGDDENAVRATAIAAKIGGWFAADKVDVVVAGGVTIQALLSDRPKIEAFLERTSHEPGAAIAAYSEVQDDVPAALTSTIENATFKDVDS